MLRRSLVHIASSTKLSAPVKPPRGASCKAHSEGVRRKQDAGNSVNSRTRGGETDEQARRRQERKLGGARAGIDFGASRHAERVRWLARHGARHVGHFV